MYKQVYIAIDLHSTRSVIGYMNKEGKYLEQKQFATSAPALIAQVVGIPAETKYLTIEQGNMAHWAASKLGAYVDELIVCDPRHNRLVSGMDTKDDWVDTCRLCQLLRLNGIKPASSSGQMGTRRLFYHQVKEYERLNKSLVTTKRQLRAFLQHWGNTQPVTQTDYAHPELIVSRLEDPALARQVRFQLERITFLANQKRRQRQCFEQTAKDAGYTEIAEFMRMPGMGVVRSHTFSAYLQTPHRFTNRRQLIKFSRLAVRHHTSDGRRLRAERLSKAGHSSLKNLSHGAWKSAMKSDNEVSGFYQASLAGCGNPDHARLNTQRKILIVLWSIWKHNRTYRPDKFYNASGVTTG